MMVYLIGVLLILDIVNREKFRREDYVQYLLCYAKELGYLRFFDLSYKNISQLDERIGLMERLEELVLRGNSIVELPVWFCNSFIYLRRLDLSGNSLTHLPVQITSLKVCCFWVLLILEAYLFGYITE